MRSLFGAVPTGIDNYGSPGEDSLRWLVLWEILETLFITLNERVGLPVLRENPMQESRLSGSPGAARSRARVWRQRAATIAVGSLAMVMGYGVVFGHNGLTAFASKRREAKVLQLQMQQLEQENERLHGHVDRLQTDPSAIEHEARQQFHYTRPGEVIYTLPVAKLAAVGH
jgi:cell division protein FtsB